MNYSDIDWSQSVVDFESKLNVKYLLSKEEIGFIEGMIKVIGKRLRMICLAKQTADRNSLAN